MKYLYLFLFAILSLTLHADPQPLALKKHGTPLTQLTREELTLKIPLETVEVADEHEGGAITKYRGFPFLKILETLYGKDLNNADELLFTCADGYQPSVPLAKFREHKAILTVEKSDGSPFRFTDPHKKEEISYGPYYLVWENLKDAGLKGRSQADWPYQVVAIDIIRFSERFPGIAPPAKSSPQTVRGFLAFRAHCLQCHKINGEGGDKVFDLNYPVSVTEYWREDWLKRWIDNPAQIRPSTAMPALASDTPDRARTIQNLVAYLKTMAKNKRVPKK